ncbi:MAG: TIGR03790 family protein [Nitrospira sp.]|nr:TIGR03790 family protein [Nitrospira sp.]
MTSSSRCLTLACLLAVVGQPSIAPAELRPQHIAILANATNADSLAVARHYAAQRNIPSEHIIPLALPFRDTISRQEYEDLVVMPLRRALENRTLHSSVRVIVTTYGVPLRVEAPHLSEEEHLRLAEAQQLVKTSRTKLEHLKQQFEQLVPESSRRQSTSPFPAQDILEAARTAALISQVDWTWRTTLDHLRQQQDPSSERSAQELLVLTQQYGGWGIMLQKRTGSEPPDTPQAAARRALLDRSSALWTGLGLHSITSHRPLLYRWAERLFGVRGVLELASAEVDRLTYTYADASLDSELSLLWWDRDLYPVAWRWDNPLFQDHAASSDQLPILMVSRLDAPTPELAKSLVDRALQAERTGLNGSVYFDARGLQPDGAIDTYGHYDHSLREAAALVKEKSSYNVVLDVSDATMAAVPNVALYIGWYKLRAYEDVFSFSPGAIGYHMASAESLTVHDRGERGWCKNALERGITATLGSVGEPYLDAFPEPARFSALLLSGKYSLAEVYYLTSRTISWRMVLFGDPLYNPMKGHSPMPLSTSPPVAPSDRRLGDPVAQRLRAQDLMRDRQKRLISLLQQAEQRLTVQPTSPAQQEAP